MGLLLCISSMFSGLTRKTDSNSYKYHRLLGGSRK